MHLLAPRAFSFTTCNTTLEDNTISEVPLWDNGWTFHKLGMIICAAFGLFAIVTSLFLITCHANHYSKPREQRHIIRILCMVPIYVVVAFFGFWKYRKSVYFTVLGSCYEAFAIAAFFSLLCHYIAPDLHTQKDYFRGIRPKKWVWPLTWLAKCCGGDRGCWRTPRSGLTWFNVIWVAVFQYCFIRVTMTVVAVVTEAFGKYCEASLSPAFSHVWVLVLESCAVTIAMYCLIQFYIQIRHDLAQYHPFLKILSIKLVIFLSFWQTTVISFLTSSGAVKPSAKVASQDLQIGIPNLLICLEMSMFAILHLWAFPWRPYTIANQEMSGDPEYVSGKITYQGGPLGIKAYANAFNPLDLLKAVSRGFRWLFVGRRSRHQDVSYMDPSSYSMKPDGGNPNMPGPQYTGYGGPGGATELGRRPGLYTEESEELLAHAQTTPAGDIGMATSYYEAPNESVNQGDRYGQAHEDEVTLRPVSPQPYQAYNPQSTPYASQTLQHPPPPVSSYSPQTHAHYGQPAYPQGDDGDNSMPLPPPGQNSHYPSPHAR